MSASERLAALAKEAELPGFEAELSGLEATLDIIAALPEIVAVVEGAEKLPEFFQTPDGRTHSFVPLLDALEEKLRTDKPYITSEPVTVSIKKDQTP